MINSGEFNNMVKSGNATSGTPRRGRVDLSDDMWQGMTPGMIAEQLERVERQRPMHLHEFMFAATELLALRSAAALDFAERRGWSLSPSYLSLGALMKGARHTVSRSRWVWRPREWDVTAEYSFHREFHAVAIALHLRDWPAVEPRWRAAAKFGLTLEVSDYPAWHSPADCHLVLMIGPIGRRKRRAPDL